MALANLLTFVVTMTNISTSSLAAAMIAPGGALLATLPVAVMTLATAIVAYPVSLAMHRFGRRPLFIAGAVAGALGGAASLLALYDRSFPLFLAGAVLLGLYVATTAFYRYAAAEAVGTAEAPRAIALVLAAGMAAALVTPAADAWANRLLEPVTFAGAFAVMTAAPLLALIPLLLSPLAPCCAPASDADSLPGPLLPALLAQPILLLGVVASATAAATMTLMMNATPLAMLGCGFRAGQSAAVIQMHVVAMFAPAFLAGEIINRLGLRQTIICGLVIVAAAALLAAGGLGFAHFAGALVLLGVGWNLLFTAGTTLIAQGATGPLRAKLQGFNEMVVFGMSALAALGAGLLLGAIDWAGIALLTMLLLLPAATLIWRLRHGWAAGAA
jgi:MFS family permease